MYFFGDLKMNGVKVINKFVMCLGIYKGYVEEGCYNINV